jgi:CO dehydrogenase nickel-insertion accessory protein CooC1
MAKLQGQIITFYSYKGGTGRSMALANVAWILASNGKKVLAIDWDLEAPGLHRYFSPFIADKELSASEGLMNMIDEFRLATITPEENSHDNWHESYTDVNGYAIPLDWDFDRGRLDILPAGRQNTAYSGLVNSFNGMIFIRDIAAARFSSAAVSPAHVPDRSLATVCAR